MIRARRARLGVGEILLRRRLLRVSFTLRILHSTFLVPETSNKRRGTRDDRTQINLPPNPIAPNPLNPPPPLLPIQPLNLLRHMPRRLRRIHPSRMLPRRLRQLRKGLVNRALRYGRLGGGVGAGPGAGGERVGGREEAGLGGEEGEFLGDYCWGVVRHSVVCRPRVGRRGWEDGSVGLCLWNWQRRLVWCSGLETRRRVAFSRFGGAVILHELPTSLHLHSTHINSERNHPEITCRK